MQVLDQSVLELMHKRRDDQANVCGHSDRILSFWPLQAVLTTSETGTFSVPNTDQAAFAAHVEEFLPFT